LQAQNQQLQQQVQQMQAQLQQAAMAQQIDQAKQQATIQKTQMETASRERIATADNATDVRMKALEAQVQMLKEAMIHGHEGTQGALDRAHEVGIAAADAGAAQAQQAQAAKMQQAQQGGGGAIPPFTGSASQPLTPPDTI